MRTMPTSTAWLVSITLMAGVAATSWYLGDQAAVTVAKIAIVPPLPSCDKRASGALPG